ncbi:hypothetical protein [Rhizobium sp. L51/94]|nr:hypothetical protein [Rhizobium sp. L51/94]
MPPASRASASAAGLSPRSLAFFAISGLISLPAQAVSFWRQ